jgi:hypothetical protein
MAGESVSSCQSCGATIYPEHLDSGIAGYIGGKLLCPHCYSERSKSAAHAPISVSEEDEYEPIELMDDPSAGTSSVNLGSVAGSTGIHGYSGDTLSSSATAMADEAKYTRKLQPGSPTAMRCRIFHSRLSPGALAYMYEQINTWVDSHEDVNIKFATSAIGVLEGKHSDSSLILTLFY